MADAARRKAARSAAADPAEDLPLTLLRDTDAHDPLYTYDRLSILLHWATVGLVFILIAIPDSWHASLGYVLAVPIAWRAVRRFARGLPRIADQPVLINVIERLTIMVMLICLILLSVSGSLVALLEGQPYMFFGLPLFQAPWDGYAIGAAFNRSLHGWAAFLFLIAFLVHMAAVIKHYIIPEHGILQRILRPGDGGK